MSHTDTDILIHARFSTKDPWPEGRHFGWQAGYAPFLDKQWVEYDPRCVFV